MHRKQILTCKNDTTSMQDHRAMLYCYIIVISYFYYMYKEYAPCCCM